MSTAGLIPRLVIAVVVAVIVGLVLVVFLGPIMVTLKVPIAVTIGDALIAWGWVIGVLAGLLFFFSGRTLSV